MKAAVLITFALCTSVQAASVSERDVLVRFKQAQNSSEDALLSTQRSLGREQKVSAQILNAREGLAKLTFATREEASRARNILSDSPDILNVTANHLYKPALRVQNLGSFPRPGVVPTPPTRPPADVELPAGPVQVGIDLLESRDWAMAAIRMPAVDATPPLLQPVITAVLDTGIDYNHEDLIHSMWRSPADPKVVGFDFAHDHAKPYDIFYYDVQGCLRDFSCAFGIANLDKFLVNPGHGTHCAGHVAAVSNNSLGIRGVGAGVKVMALKFFFDVGETNAGSGDDAAAIRSIDYAIQNGAKVISASWGDYIPRTDAEASELKRALLRAQQAGVLFIAAAGNGRVSDATGDFEQVDQDNDASPTFPAAFALDNVISVAAVDSSDQLAEFSNFGASSVHIAAPGVKIFSTVAAGNASKYDDVIARVVNPATPTASPRDITWEGTSMAVPLVAGAAALVWSRYPHLSYRDVREVLMKSARVVPGLAGKVSSNGVLDVEAALAAASILPPESISLSEL